MTSRPAIAALIAAVVLGTFAAPVLAASSVTTGWWTTLPLSAAPDAPGDGLVVQGGRGGEPMSYAAVTYALTDGEEPQRLVLTVAEGSASTPNTVLEVCPLTEDFIPAQGGPMDGAPSYDCSSGAEASPSDDGSQYEFEVRAMVGTTTLAVAVIPTAATDRVVLDRPGLESLRGSTTTPTTVTPGPESPDRSAADGSEFGESDAGDTSFNTPTSSDSSSTGGFDSSMPELDLDTPESSDGAASDSPPSTPTTDEEEGDELSAPPVLEAQPAGTSDDRSSLAGPALAGLALLAATLWLSAGRFGTGVDGALAAEPASSDH